MTAEQSPTLIANPESAPSPSRRFTAPVAQWTRAVGFLLSMALTGLGFYPALLLVAAFMINAYQRSRYDFIIQFMIFCGGFCLLVPDVLPFKTFDIGLICGFISMAIVKPTPTVRRLRRLTLAYFAALFLFALTSDESLAIQFLMMRNYMTIVLLFIPMVIFSGQKFEWDQFMHSTLLYTLVLCAFYAIDTYILNGLVLVPSANTVEGATGQHYSSINYIIWRPFSGWTPRHYPNGLFWLIIPLVPLVRRQITLDWKWWVIILLAIISTKTMTFTAGIIVTALFFCGINRRNAIYILIALIALFGVYKIDQYAGSPLRIASTVQQFTDLSNAQTDEDIASFGTGRMAQTIPKLERLEELHRLPLGFGFLHPALTTNPKYQISNELYRDDFAIEEVATGVEITQVQTILDIGILGLIIQAAYFITLYGIIRRMPHSRIYIAVLLGISIFGIGGFAGLNAPMGLIPLATTIAAIYLSDKTTNDQQSPINE